MKRWYIVGMVMIALLASCGNRGEEVIERTAPEETNETADSVSFQEIDITADGGQFHIIGQVRTTSDVFFYRIEQDGEIIQEEESVELEEEGQGDFQDFEIMETFSKEILETEIPPIVVMYVKDEDNNEINPNYVPIDTEE